MIRTVAPGGAVRSKQQTAECAVIPITGTAPPSGRRNSQAPVAPSN